MIKQNLYAPSEVSGCSVSEAEPIYGISTRMLVQGGPWDLTAPPEVLLKAGSNIPRKRAVREWYGGQDIEPDPHISSFGKTTTIVHRMIDAHWSRTQIESALLDRANKGGDWFRWCDRPDQFLDHILDTYKSNHPNKIQKPSNQANRTTPISLSVGYEGIEIIPEILALMLGFIEASPRTKNDCTDRSHIKRKGVAAKYVAYMEQEGLIHFVPVTTERREGKRMVKRNRTIAVKGPAPFHEELRQVLGEQFYSELEGALV